MSKRRYRFFMPTMDNEVATMLNRRGHTCVYRATEPYHIMLLTGGADVCPMLYGEKLHPETRFNMARDLAEIGHVKRAHHQRMKVGICRGGQLLNVLSGGRMWQHVNNHAITGTHEVQLWFMDTVLNMSSRHHQMMIPGTNGLVLGEAKEATRFESFAEGPVTLTPEQRMANGWNDTEIVYYEETHSLCYQPHPEDDDDDAQDFFFALIDEYWSDQLHETVTKT